MSLAHFDVKSDKEERNQQGMSGERVWIPATS